MKTLNKICWIAAIVLGLGSLLLFFADFATITAGGNEVTVVGAQLGFGATVKAGGTEYNLAKSSQILFCLLLTAVAAALSIFSFKSKKLRYAAPAVGIVSAVYMLVMALSYAGKYVDYRPLANVTNVAYEPFMLITAIALFLYTAFALAYLLIDDYLEVMASKDGMLTIPKRIVRYLRDYKSEVKKIVWPGWKDVVKNTVIVLIICLIVGAFIWAVDFGLAELVKLILGV